METTGRRRSGREGKPEGAVLVSGRALIPSGSGKIDAESATFTDTQLSMVAPRRLPGSVLRLAGLLLCAFAVGVLPGWAQGVTQLDADLYQVTYRPSSTEYRTVPGSHFDLIVQKGEEDAAMRLRRALRQSRSEKPSTTTGISIGVGVRPTRRSAPARLCRSACRRRIAASSSPF